MSPGTNYPNYIINNIIKSNCANALLHGYFHFIGQLFFTHLSLLIDRMINLSNLYAACMSDSEWLISKKKTINILTNIYKVKKTLGGLFKPTNHSRGCVPPLGFPCQLAEPGPFLGTRYSLAEKTLIRQNSLANGTLNLPFHKEQVDIIGMRWFLR